MSVRFQCERCSNCCRWPGQVKLEEAEVDRLAAFLGLEPRDFVERYARLRLDRRGLALVEQPTGECVFLDGNECRVQAVKPQQCRDYPGKWQYPGSESICQGTWDAAPAEEAKAAADERSGE